MKAKYTAPNLDVLLLQSAQNLANTDIPFDNLKDPNFTGSGSFAQGGAEIDIPL